MNCVCGNFFGVFTPFFAKCCCNSVCTECILTANYSQLLVYNTQEIVFETHVKCPACKANARRFRVNLGLSRMARQVLLLRINNKHIDSCSSELYDLGVFGNLNPIPFIVPAILPPPVDSLDERLRAYVSLVFARASEFETNMAEQNKTLKFSSISMDDLVVRAKSTSLAAALLKSTQPTPPTQPAIKHAFLCSINWKTITMAFDENFRVMRPLAFVLKFGPSTKIFARCTKGFVRLFVNKKTVAYVLMSAVCVEDYDERFMCAVSTALPARLDTSTDNEDADDERSTSTTCDMDAMMDESVASEDGEDGEDGEDDDEENEEDEEGELHWFKAGDLYAKRLSRDVYVYCENLAINSYRFNYFAKETSDETKHILDYENERERIDKQIHLIHKYATALL